MRAHPIFAASLFAVAVSTSPILAHAQAMGPRAITVAVEQASRECRASGGTFVTGQGFDTRLSLNDDEAPDHIVDFGAAECRNARSDYAGPARGGDRDDGCGRNGCRVQVFLSGPRGHQSVFSEPVWAVAAMQDTAPARLRFSASSMPGCEASYAEGCHAEWGWRDGRFVRLRWLTRDDLSDAPSDDSVVYTPPKESVAHEEKNVRQFMAAVYEPYKLNDFSNYLSELFSPSLDRIIEEGSDPDIGLGCDVIVGGQDFERVDYRIDDIQIDGDRARVAIRDTSFGSPWRSKTYVLERSSAGWLIDDIIFADGERFRQTLRC